MGREKDESSFFSYKNLQKVSRILLDFSAVTEEATILDSAYEVLLDVASMIHCYSNELAKEHEACLLKR